MDGQREPLRELLSVITMSDIAHPGQGDECVFFYP